MNDHLVLDCACRPPLLRCLECGATHQVKLPMAITEAVKLSDQFQARHRACKPRQVGIQIAQPAPPATLDLDALLSPEGAYERGTGHEDGAQLVDQLEWWAPVFGCDTLDNLLDRIRARILPHLRPPIAGIDVPGGDGDYGNVLDLCAAEGVDPRVGVPLLKRARETWGNTAHPALPAEDGPAVPEGREPASVVGEPCDEELLGLDQLEAAWNAQADAANGWNELGLEEIIVWAQRQALARWGYHPAPPAEGEVATIAARLKELSRAVTKERWQEFSMSVPAEPLRDADEDRLYEKADGLLPAHAHPEPAMPSSYIDPGHSEADRKLLETFYRATNSEGGTADEIYLRGIHAVLALARPLLEQVARMGDCIGANTVGQITAISDRAASWLRENPPGQPVAIEPRGCPTPGACSCVEPAPPAEGEVSEKIRKALIVVSGGLCYHSAEAKHAQLQDVHKLLTETAALLQQHQSPQPVPVSERLQQMEDLAADAVSALRYIEQSYGLLFGVGWDRVYEKAYRLLPANALPLPAGEVK